MNALPELAILAAMALLAANYLATAINLYCTWPR